MNKFCRNQFTALLGALCLMVVGLACQRYTYQGVPETGQTNLRYHFSFPASQKSDILLVIDNSGSMLEEQQNLKRNASGFIERILQNNRDFRLALISVDPATTDKPAGTFLPIPGTDGIVGPTSFLVSPQLDNNPNLAAERTNLIRRVELALELFQQRQGATNESGLQAMWSALDPKSEAAAGNGSFVRQDADLIVVFMTDEDDCSPANPSVANNAFWQRSNTACYAADNQGNLAKPGVFVERLLTIKPDIQQIRAAFISGFQDSAANGIIAQGCVEQANQPSFSCGCWSAIQANSPSEQNFFCSLSKPPLQAEECAMAETCSEEQAFCNNQCLPICTSIPARRYGEFALTLQQKRLDNNLSGGVFTFPICTEDFKEPLLAIADQIIAPSCLKLKQPLTNERAVVVKQRLIDETEQERLVTLYQVDSNQNCASCPQCTDGAFFVRDQQEICLACGATIKAGSQFEVEVAIP